MSGASTPVNPLDMADEDILSMSTPPAAEAAGEGDEGGESDPNNGAPAGDQPDTDDPPAGDEGEGDGGEGGDGGDPAGDGQDPPAGSGEGTDDGATLSHQDMSQEGHPDPTGAEGGNPATQGKPAEGKGKGGQQPPTPEAEGDQGTPPDYKALYEQLMSPIKANGKMIELRSPEELKQLAQMGANYTRKMQAIAPHRKILLMLENNGLLDEGKLSFLIDIEKKNPEAIKKLIKDAGIDPRDIDPDEEPNYTLHGNHRVSDEEAAFAAALEELRSTPEGLSTLQLMNTQWDQASKELLWKQPDIMALIHEQRESGIYDRVSTEVERLRALGQIPPNIPFLQAYKAVGEQMAQAGAFADLVSAQPQHRQQPAQPAPVATRVQTPKPAVKNGDKVNAASPTRATPRKAEPIVNPLALSDEEFEKQFLAYQGRV